MTTLYHEITVKASPAQIWNVLTTRAGLNQWWPGSVSIFGGDSWQMQPLLSESRLVFKVIEEQTHKVLEWLCTEGEDCWPNTLVHWRIEPLEDCWKLVVEHRDLRETPSQLAALNTQWGGWVHRIAEQFDLADGYLGDV